MPEKPADRAPRGRPTTGRGGGGPLEQTAVRSTGADDAPPRRPPATPEQLVPGPGRDALRRDQRVRPRARAVHPGVRRAGPDAHRRGRGDARRGPGRPRRVRRRPPPALRLRGRRPPRAGAAAAAVHGAGHPRRAGRPRGLRPRLHPHAAADLPGGLAALAAGCVGIRLGSARRPGTDRGDGRVPPDRPARRRRGPADRPPAARGVGAHVVARPVAAARPARGLAPAAARCRPRGDRPGNRDRAVRGLPAAGHRETRRSATG